MLPVRAVAQRLPARFWRSFGRLARLLRRHRLAARAYALAARIAPQRAVYHHDLGTALATLKRHQAAIHAYRQALVLDPHMGRSYRALGRLQRRLDRHAEAARAFARAAALLPEDAQLFHDLGTSLSQLGRHDGAAQAFAQAVRLQPGHAGWYRALGRALRACRQHGEAAIALGQASSLRPDDAQAHFEHAREWLACGRYLEALEPLQKALALQPEQADSALAWHRCLAALGWRLPAAMEAELPGEIEHITLSSQWRQRVAACTCEWTYLSPGPELDKGLLHALYRRAQAGAGLVSEREDALGPLLCRTRLLKACVQAHAPDVQGLGPWLKARLRHHSLQPRATVPVPQMLAAGSLVWIIHNASLAARELAASYQQLGYRPQLIDHADLPATTDALRAQVLAQLPAWVHDISGHTAALESAFDGLCVRLISGTTEVPATTALARLVRATRYRVGCVVGGGIGNMVQCSPAIRHLAEHLGQPVDVLLSEDAPGCAHLFSGAPWVAMVFSRVADAQAVRFDLLVVLDPFSHQLPALMAERIAAPRLMLPLAAMQQLHEAEYHLKGLELTLGIPYAATAPGNYFIGTYTRRPGAPRRVGLHAGCKAGRWRAKRWPYFEELAQRLSAAGLEVISVGGTDERVPGTLDYTGLPLHASIEAIASCAYFISNDSGLMHIADALGIPLTSIFGPSSVSKNGPLAASSQVVQLHKACAPCQFDTARLKGCKCIGEIPLEAVWGKVTRHLRTLPGIGALALVQNTGQASTADNLVPTLTLDPQPYSTRQMDLLLAAQAWHPARALLCTVLGSAPAMERLNEDDVAQLLHFAWVLAAQRLLAPAAARLARRFPHNLLAIVECAAAVLEPCALDALILECGSWVLSARQPVPVLQWLTASCRYARAAALVEVLHRVDASPHARLLQDPGVAAEVGEALLGSDLSFRLPGTGLTDSTLRSLAPLELLIEDALLRQDRAGFIQRVNAYLDQQGSAADLVRLLKNLTGNAALLQLTEGDITYGGFDAYQDNLLLAIHLNDAAMVQRSALYCVPDAMANLLWRARQHDYGPLNATLARQLALAGAAPVTFEGQDRLALFHACLAGARLPDADDHGLVSVILCVHAPEPLLLRLAVDSVLGQTYRQLELILVDDGNTPADAALIASFADPRIRLVRSPRNLGVYQCRNLGVAAARGKFITFHDADDVAHPQRIEVQLAALLNTPGCQLCYASHIRFDAAGGVQLEINPDRLNLLGDGPVTALLRRETFSTVGPFENVRTRGDIELRQRIQKCYGAEAVLQLDVPLLYCAGGATTLSNRSMARYRHQIRLLRRAFHLRAWPQVVEGVLADAPVGELAVPHPLRGGLRGEGDEGLQRPSGG